MRALQLMNGATNMVMSRSFQLEIVRVAIIPGIAQAMLDINGTTLLPFKPNGRINRSMMNTTRYKYPLSSKMEMKKNNMAICGTKTTTPPIPGIIPSEIKSFTIPGGIASALHVEKYENN